MKYGSVCSGIESATVAWHPLGWQAQFYAEIEPFPSAVLAHHYPEIPNLGDITKFKGWRDFAGLDVLVGGTPCQSFSVAGLRAGLADPRGNLMLTYLAIAKRYRPAWLVWENVPGVLSSGGGGDFGVFVWALGQLGYGWAYRVLDAQYFNLAQRRARVFVVASARGWQVAAAVLFERSCLSGDTAPRRESRQDIARTVAGGSRKRGGFSYDDVEQIGRPLRAQSNSSHDDSKDTYIAHSLRADGFDASEDGTGRGTPLVAVEEPLTASERKRIAAIESLIQAFGGNNTSSQLDVATAVNAKGGSGRMDFESETLLCFDETQISSAENRCNPQPGDPSPPLAAGARPPTIAFSNTGGDTNLGVDVECSPPITARHGDPGHVAQPYTLASRGRDDGHNLEFRQDGIANAILTPNGGRGGIGVGAIATKYAVRRLTPRECERLQGFEDDYTLIPYHGPRKKPAKDGPRYKALGNSKAVPVVRWLGLRIDRVDHILRSRVA